MVWADYLIILVVLVSALIGVWRGFIREAFSLGTWVLAFWVSLFFSHPFAGLLQDVISEPSLRLGVAYLSLFIMTLLVGALVNHLASSLVKVTGLGGMDRMLGVIFGLARGVVVVVILVILAGLTPMPGDSWWKHSFFIEYFEVLAIWSQGILPDDIAAYFRY